MSALMSWQKCGWLAVYALLLVGGGLVGRLLLDIAAVEIRPSNEPQLHMMILTTAVVFALASALPFVPGAEIGFAMLMLFGHRVAPLVYACMVSALLLAYGVGRLMPLTTTAAVLGFLHLRRARDLALGLSTLEPAQVPEMIAGHAPRRFVPMLLRHRYIALVVLLNLPGNSLLGGGGGIAFSAGLCRLFGFPAYLAAILVAVAPVPLMFALSGW